MKRIKKKFNKPTKIIIISIYLISLIIGVIFIFVYGISGDLPIYTELIIFNGIAMTYIIILVIVSCIKLGIIESDKNMEKTFLLLILISWIIAFIASFSIVVVYDNTSLINNPIFDFFSIFLTFLIFSAISDVICFGGGL